MRRYWFSTDSAPKVGASIQIEGDLLHHIRDVCRQSIGDRFELIFSGQAALVEIESEKKGLSRARVIELRVIPELPYPRIGLALCFPRLNIFDRVLEKAVELGVETIQPLFSARSYLRVGDSSWQNKADRWRKIIQSATQQSGRASLLDLKEPRTLEVFMSDLAETSDAVNRSPKEMCLFAYEMAHLSMQAELHKIKTLSRSAPSRIWLLIGSEGGFTSEEVASLQAAKIMPITLGAQVLRVETACVTLLGILKYELGLMGEIEFEIENERRNS